MSTKLSQRQLTELFAARGKRQQAHNEYILRRVYQLLGKQAEPEHPVDVLIRDKTNDAMAALLAQRLYADDRSVPLISSNDTANLVPMIVDEICQAEPDLFFDAEERQVFERFLQNMMRGMGDAFPSMVPSDEDPYDEYHQYHQWVATILAIADEQGKTPTDVILSQEGSDEVNRRLYSKSQFIKLHREAFDKVINPETMKQAFIQPMMDALAVEVEDEDELEMHQEMCHEMEASMEPELQEMCDKMLHVTNDWFAEETARIYAT